MMLSLGLVNVRVELVPGWLSSRSLHTFPLPVTPGITCALLLRFYLRPLESLP